MELLWPILLGLLFGGYLVVDGFDIGTGLLLRRLGRTDRDRRALLTSIGPFFLGNEVWLVAVGGLITAAFPLLKDRAMGGLYLLMVVGLLIWVLRDGAVWFRSRRSSARWRSGWDLTLVSASSAFALFWGLVIGALLNGLPAAGAGGTITGLWRGAGPYALLWAAVTLTLFAAHGAAFLAARLPSDLVPEAETLAARLLTAAAGLLGLAVLLGLLLVVPRETAVLLPVGAAGALAVGALWLARGSLAARRYGTTIAFTSFAVASPVLMIGFRLAPDLAGGGADPGSLRVLGGFLLFVVPALAVMQAWMWWAFRHRVGPRTVVFF